MERSTANFFLLSLDMAWKGKLLHKKFLLPAKVLILKGLDKLLLENNGESNPDYIRSN